MQVKEVGEINYFLSYFINWNLPRLFDTSLERGLRLWSPKFAYIEEEKNYILLPATWTNYSYSSEVKLSLTSSANDGHPFFIMNVGLADELGKELIVSRCTWNKTHKWYDATLVNRYDFQRRCDGEFPNGFLRLFLILKTCREVADVAIQTEEGKDKLNQDFEALFRYPEDSDLIIKVKHREFHVHRGILRARSSVFDSMFSYGFRENIEGFVNIEDCEPDVFEKFLLFVYSGKTDYLCADNACSLYCASDKYNVPDLKEKCINYLKKSFTIENICEVICLAKKHSEVKLLNFATEYFAKHMNKILASNNWLQFQEDNPFEARELYIKSLKFGYKKKA